MATSPATSDNPTSRPSNTEEAKSPQIQLSIPITAGSAAGTAPSYSPICATAQPNEMSTFPTPADTRIPSGPTTTMLPTSTSTSPPPPQPGAVPDPTTTSQSQIQQQQSTEEPHPPPPAPAPAPKSLVAPTPAPLPSPSTISTANNSHSPIITAPPAFPPPTTTSATSTLISTYGASTSNQTPQSTSGTYNNSYSYSYSSSTYPQHQQQPHHPNSTTTPYASIYCPPSTASASTTLPLHNNSTPGAYAGVEPSLESEEEAGLWGSAKSWFQSAGNKLAEVEAEVWRRINEAHDK